jgi:hypothetical protein
MSDNYLCFVPTDPDFVPSDEAAEVAVRLLRSFGGDIKIERHDRRQFVYGGVNFDGADCPVCGASLDGWWEDAMAVAHASAFADLNVLTPCGHQTSLNELAYRWPAAFARFWLECWNPGMREDDSVIEGVSRALGTTVKTVWAHI